MTSDATIPPAHTFAWTIVQSLRALGGSGRIEEVNEEAVRIRGLTEEQQLVPHKIGGRTEIEYRLAWARTLAKAIGLTTNSERGVWALTDLGRRVSEDQVEELKVERRRRVQAERKARKKAASAQGTEATQETLEDDDEPGEGDWQAELLEILKGISPDGFERLSRRLLREAGFVNVTVTGGTGDGGIDGSGVYRMSLVSFPVYFQCKRYQGTVSASKVRDFRGAMVGRGEKGLLITTGTFTADAQAEATRDGAPPVDLVDGKQLTELLRQYNLGVRSVARTVYDVTIEESFFEGM